MSRFHPPEPNFSRSEWGWKNLSNPDTRELHCMPLMDVGAHAFDADCECQPFESEAGYFVHNSFDGREAYEQGLAKYN